jgi:hypothetical protein
MKLVRIDLENVRNLPDGAHPIIGSTRDGTQPVTLVTGPVGSGKTTLLEAVLVAKERAAGLLAPPNPRPFLRRSASNGTIALTFVLEPEELAASGLVEPVQRLAIRLSGGAASTECDPRFARHLRGDTSGQVAYFPADRRLSNVAPHDAPSSLDGARMLVAREGHKFTPVMRWLRERLEDELEALSRRIRAAGIALASDEPRALTPFRTALARLCPTLRLAGLSTETRGPWFERDDGAVLELDELSAGQRDAVLLAGAIGTAELKGAVILIDRLDAHAGEDELVTWLDALAGLTQRSQWLVTARSPHLAARIHAAHHLRLEA